MTDKRKFLVSVKFIIDDFGDLRSVNNIVFDHLEQIAGRHDIIEIDVEKLGSSVGGHNIDKLLADNS